MSTKQKILWALFVLGMIGIVGAGPLGGIGIGIEQGGHRGIFCYAMYDFYNQAGGEKKLARTGIHGQATVLTAKMTNTQWATGEAAYRAPFAWRYGLEVTLPGKAPYRAELLTLERFNVGEVIPVSAKRNRLKHVAFNPQGTVTGASGAGSTRAARLATLTSAASAAGVQISDGSHVFATVRTRRGSDTQIDVADEIAKLAELRDKGVLTSAEFDARKAKLLAE